MLMDLQQEASLRQVFRGQRNQRPFSVNIDEFGTFADRSFIDSLNKLRDANILFTLSHQTSTRAVESLRLHPNRLKMLASRGQGFLFASRPDGQVAIPVAYGRLPDLPLPPEAALGRNDQARARGLRLYDTLGEPRP
jgi:hypothetical protein